MVKTDYSNTIYGPINHKQGSDIEARMQKFERVLDGKYINNSEVKENPAYVASLEEGNKKMRNAILTRKLNGMPQEEFENEYYRLYHGIKGLESKATSVPETAIVTRKERSIVPVQIDAATQIRTGHTEKYLVRYCQENELTREELDSIIYLKERYSTSLPTVARLLNAGYDLDRIQEVLEVRSEFDKNSDGGVPSLKKLMAFSERFGLDGEELIEAINEVYDSVGHLRNGKGIYVDQAIQNVLTVAEGLPEHGLETILDAMTSNLPLTEDDEEREHEESFF